MRGLHYDPEFLTRADQAAILAWLKTIRPIWEMRFSKHHPPTPGEKQRPLLRPVYWLGNWQFACLGYYFPPNGVENRCVRAEPFPASLAKLIPEIESRAHAMFKGEDMPQNWKLNTCLVNFYGSRIEGSKKIDTARVGEHRDHEPGPVASLSLGERAMFQFVQSDRPGTRNAVITQQWLDHGSLQIFGSKRWKRQLFHRVQRVDTKGRHKFDIGVEGFETRRINFTFRYVPEKHIVRYCDLPPNDQEDVREYMAKLAESSPFFRSELANPGAQAPGLDTPTLKSDA